MMEKFYEKTFSLSHTVLIAVHVSIDSWFCGSYNYNPQWSFGMHNRPSNLAQRISQRSDMWCSTLCNPEKIANIHSFLDIDHS